MLSRPVEARLTEIANGFGFKSYVDFQKSGWKYWLFLIVGHSLNEPYLGLSADQASTEANVRRERQQMLGNKL